jgi:L-fuculose-phosphate aldolase
MNTQGEWTGERRPSSEWRFHLDILNTRSDVNAVVHAHPPYCTSLSILERPIPPIHYMVAVTGGSDIRCASYATFGTAELSENALVALQGRKACLLAHHGMIATGPSLDRAMWLAVEVETLARQYLTCLQVKEPPLLSEQEIQNVISRISGYGHRS